VFASVGIDVAAFPVDEGIDRGVADRRYTDVNGADAHGHPNASIMMRNRFRT
jgi:hypothetical protein